MIKKPGNFRLQVLLSSILIAALSSCAPAYLYMPGIASSPLLSEQGEVQLSAYTGSFGYTGRVAYAPLQNVGIITTGAFTARQKENNQRTEFLYGEVAAGGFLPVKENVILELYSGYGRGSSLNLDSIGLKIKDGEKSAYYTRMFLHMNVGWKSEMFHSGLALRTAYLKFNEFNFSSAVMFEPTVFTRIGSEILKVEAQLGYSLPISQQGEFTMQNINFNVGLNFAFNQRVFSKNSMVAVRD
jgi:hypothetical protein